MSNWYVGQKVVCVYADTEWCGAHDDCVGLKKGKTYTIASTGITHLGRPGIKVVECPRPSGLMFRTDRFRPLDPLQEQLSRIESEPELEPQPA